MVLIYKKMWEPISEPKIQYKMGEYNILRADFGDQNSHNVFNAKSVKGHRYDRTDIVRFSKNFSKDLRKKIGIDVPNSIQVTVNFKNLGWRTSRDGFTDLGKKPRLWSEQDYDDDTPPGPIIGFCIFFPLPISKKGKKKDKKITKK